MAAETIGGLFFIQIWMNYAFLDESGDPADPRTSKTGTRYFVVAVLVTAQPRAVALRVRQARHAGGGRLSGGEFKARRVQAKVIERLLTALAVEEISLYVVVADKEAPRQARGEDLYRQAIALAVQRCVARSPRLHLTLDKRYTGRKQQTDLETAIRTALAGIPENVVIIEARNSEAVPELQAVDFVAWAFGQKYERGNASFAQLLAARVAVEEWLK